MNIVLRENVTYYDDFARFLREIEKFDETVAIKWFDRKREEHQRTYKELTSDVKRLIRSFDSMGIAGKHIAISAENCYEWTLVYLAAVATGGVAVCIDIEQSAETIVELASRSDACVLFIGENNLDIGKMAMDAENQLEQIVVLDKKENQQYLTIEDLLAKGDTLSEAEEIERTIKPEQTAAIVFTSGTTGLSKPVMLSHRALLANAIDSITYVEAGPVVFTALPLCHTYGMTCSILATWIRGATVVLNGSLKTVMQDLHQSKAYSILTVPLMLEAMHNQMWIAAEREGKADGLRKVLKLEGIKRKLGFKTPLKVLRNLKKTVMGSLEVMICGGAHMDHEIAQEFDLMGVTVLQGYGITECSPLVAVNGTRWNKMDSVGMVLPSYEVKLDEEEICVRGKSVMNGYYKMPEETAEAFDGEWFRTGDIGKVDKDGFLYITGRKKNLIVFKNGKKVSPESLEEKIRQFSLVKDVMVYGATSGVSADDVKIAVSIYPDTERAVGLSSYEILGELQREIDVLNDTLPLYQQIQMVNIREQEFNKTAMMKIKRHTV
ncbi:long-chain acyl-CoA synthetase [Clostridiales Family XIII bacterium PM5-7]